jgi:hypothetical protein
VSDEIKTNFGGATAIFAVVASALAVLLTGAVAGAAPQSACTTTSGVTVIVDFTHFSGGKIERGCAPGQPANGLIALHAAGFATAGTVQYGDAFVCRIDGLPTPKQDACAVTPSPSAFWAYWTAKPSDSAWTYSALGVLDFHPKPGTIEAFAFGNHAQPGVAPSAAIPTTTTTTTAAPPTTPPTPITAATLPPPTAPALATTTNPPVVARGPTTTAAKTPKAKPTTTTATTATTAGSSDAHASTSTTVAMVERSASGPTPHSGSGSPTGTILAVVIVGGLAIGAFAFTRARRRPAA